MSFLCPFLFLDFCQVLTTDKREKNQLPRLPNWRMKKKHREIYSIYSYFKNSKIWMMDSHIIYRTRLLHKNQMRTWKKYRPTASVERDESRKKGNLLYGNVNSPVCFHTNRCDGNFNYVCLMKTKFGQFCRCTVGVSRAKIKKK